jgi:hypothetical protein
MKAVKLVATSDYNTAGDQRIGRVTGLSTKFGLALDWCGTRSGKRREATTAVVTIPGLYMLRSTTRKGVDETYVLAWDFAGVTIRTECTIEEATEIAADLTSSTIARQGRIIEARDTEAQISDSESRDPDEMIDVGLITATELGIAAGKHSRRDLIAARRAYVHRLRGIVTPELPIELDGGPSDPKHRRAALETERARLLARLAQIEAELAPMMGAS